MDSLQALPAPCSRVRAPRGSFPPAPQSSPYPRRAGVTGAPRVARTRQMGARDRELSGRSLRCRLSYSRRARESVDHGVATEVSPLLLGVGSIIVAEICLPRWGSSCPLPFVIGAGPRQARSEWRDDIRQFLTIGAQTCLQARSPTTCSAPKHGTSSMCSAVPHRRAPGIGVRWVWRLMLPTARASERAAVRSIHGWSVHWSWYSSWLFCFSCMASCSCCDSAALRFE